LPRRVFWSAASLAKKSFLVSGISCQEESSGHQHLLPRRVFWSAASLAKKGFRGSRQVGAAALREDVLEATDLSSNVEERPLKGRDGALL
jgi:hypothetical protein